MEPEEINKISSIITQKTALDISNADPIQYADLSEQTVAIVTIEVHRRFGET
jgi:hypothetical protein